MSNWLLRGIPEPFRRQAGLTAVETMVSLVVLVAIIVLAGGAATSITNLQRQSQSRMQAERTSRSVLNRLRDELTACTLDKDPLTDLYRYESLVDGSGRPTVRFQTMAGTRMEDGEVVPDWSPWIEYRVEADGVVTRSESGSTMNVATGVDSIAIAAQVSGRFQITCVTTYVEPGTGDTVTRTDREYVMPLN